MTYAELEKKTKEIAKSSKPLHGLARDIAFDMALREMWEQEQKRRGRPEPLPYFCFEPLAHDQFLLGASGI